MKEVWVMENGVEVDTWTWEGVDTRIPNSEFGNKADWGEGPWVDEPDKLSWTDPGTNMPCLIVRGPSGSFCGYAGVVEPHPYFGRSYSTWGEELPGPDVTVHGGLTFADACQPGEDEEHGICHVPQPGQSDHVWWFGFDCAHAYDFSPGLQHTLERCYIDKGEPLPEYTQRRRDDVYRDVSYVMAQVTMLSIQLAALHTPELA